jgi:alpha/beta superfamily hydrolase
MADGKGMSQRFEEYRPSKTALFWSCAGCIAATMIVGFSWGGWVTGGSAKDMAEQTAEQVAAQVAAAVCIEKFMAAGDAATQLASLKQTSSPWQQENFIEDGGWAVIADQAYDGAAELCAEQLIEMEAPAAQEASAAEAGSVTP